MRLCLRSKGGSFCVMRAPPPSAYALRSSGNMGLSAIDSVRI
jgi:hypothetical protein